MTLPKTLFLIGLAILIGFWLGTGARVPANPFHATTSTSTVGDCPPGWTAKTMDFDPSQRTFYWNGDKTLPSFGKDASQLQDKITHDIPGINRSWLELRSVTLHKNPGTQWEVIAPRVKAVLIDLEKRME